MSPHLPHPESAALSNAFAGALFAVDPVGLGGVALRGASGPVREQWLARLAAWLPAGTPWRRVPLHINDDRLLGGLDLSATLQTGRPVAQRGLLAEADGGIVLLAMAERLSASMAASIAAVIDTHEMVAERQGIGLRSASRIGVVALDEGEADDEQMPARLRERLAFHLTLPARLDPPEVEETLPDRSDVAEARERFASVRVGDAIVEGLCAASLALGIDSVRAAMLACRAARAAAALDGRDEVNAQDAALAAALVLAPRATQVPVSSAPAEEEPDSSSDPADPDPDADPAAEPPSDEAQSAGEPPPEAPSEPAPDSDDKDIESPQGPVDDVVLEAALAAIPPGLLALLALGHSGARRALTSGRVGAVQRGPTRGRPIGVRRGEPQGGARLNVIETLRAAAPWQTLRRREAEASASANANANASASASASASANASAASAAPRSHRIQVRRADFHVWRFKQHSETTTVFVVDASGSAALHRLAETKGAVELLLADCYVRRDSVAVIAFRGAAAEVLLPPTRSLVRAKRSLAGLPGGGGTPLAAGIAAAHTMADAVRRRGATPVVVLLTDGRGNIARDGTPGRVRANEDALAAARQMRAEGFAVLLLDTSPQAQEPARQLAAAMGARYLPLPHAGAALLSQAVRAAGASAGAGTGSSAGSAP